MRCRFCFANGHNIRTCPSRSKESKDNRAINYKQKSCTFCGVVGHNRRTCNDVNVYTIKLNRKVVEYKENFVSQLLTKGLGPGALVSLSYNKETLGYVTKINWNTALPDGFYHNYFNITYFNFKLKREQDVSLTNIVVQAPTEETVIRGGIPDDFFHSHEARVNDMIERENKVWHDMEFFATI